MKRRAQVEAVLLTLTLAACDRTGNDSRTEPGASASHSTTGYPRDRPAPRRGMVWIEGGPLVAGTAPDSLPRIADQEMPGEQVILKSFYIDVFPYPNEEGALPLTNITQAEADAHCKRDGKRLCSELEWERACKGPRNLRHAYGDLYQAERCETGGDARLRPSGLLVGCRSAFGVHDLHGGVWEWTLSPWGRGTPGQRVALRAGNGPVGEVVGRCAHARPQAADRRSPTVGFRCCAGPVNEARVVLSVRRGKELETTSLRTPQIQQQLRAALADGQLTDLAEAGDFVCRRAWRWHPIGNEELLVVGGCSGIGRRPQCGVAVARMVYDRAKLLAWASSGGFMPTVQLDVDPRDLWVFGGDAGGQFRRLVGYEWGRVNVGDRQRRVPKRKRKD